MQLDIQPWSLTFAQEQIPALAAFLITSSGELPPGFSDGVQSAQDILASGDVSSSFLLSSVSFERFAAGLAQLGRTLFSNARFTEASYCCLGAHEVWRLRSPGRPPTDARRRCFDVVLRCSVQESLQPLAGREVLAEVGAKRIAEIVAKFGEYVATGVIITANGYLVDELERLRETRSADEDFQKNLVTKNLRTVLTLAIPNRCLGVRRKWRQLGQTIAPYVLMEVAEVSPQPVDTLDDLVSSAARAALNDAIENADIVALGKALEQVEGAITRNLELRIAVSPEFLEPESSMNENGKKNIDPYFDAAKKLLRAGNSAAIQKFEETERRTNNTIALEWAAYAYIKFEPTRISKIVATLEQCIASEKFAAYEGHQWVARWNLACALRRQTGRRHEALDILVPVLTRTRFRSPAVLDLCIRWAIEDDRLAEYPQLLELSRYPEAYLLGALHATRRNADRQEMRDHFLRVETILHEVVAFPSPGEDLEKSQFEEIVDAFRRLHLSRAGVQWFQERLFEERNKRQFYLNYKSLGMLYEDIGELQKAWQNHSRGVELSLENPKLLGNLRKSTLTDLLRFAQTVESARAEASGFLTKNWERAGLSQPEFDLWMRNLTGTASRAPGSNKPAEEIVHPTVLAGPAASYSERPVSVAAPVPVKEDVGAAQRTVDRIAPIFATIRRSHELRDNLSSARELCAAVLAKHGASSGDLLAAYERFFESVEKLFRGLDETQSAALLTTLRNELTTMRSPVGSIRDLQELSSACGRVVQDLEGQLKQQFTLDIRLPSGLGLELEQTENNEGYESRLFLQVTNPYEFAVPLSWLHVSSTSPALRLPVDGLQLNQVIPPGQARIIECPIAFEGSGEPDIQVTFHVHFDVGGISRVKRESDRLPIRPNAPRIPVEERFTTSPVPAGRDDLFHGREGAIQDLLNGMSGGRLRTLYFINGIRRVGKTTLLRQLGYRLRKTTLAIVIDLEVVTAKFGFAQTISTEQFIRQLTVSMLERHRRNLDLPAMTLLPLAEKDFGSDPVWSYFDAWLGELLLQSGAERLLLCIDEMQHVIKRMASGVMDESLLPWLRDKVESNSETLIVCSASEPYGKMRMRHDHNLWGSIKTYPISFLQKADMAKVAQEPVASDGVRWLEEAIDELWDMTEGHPWITQGICDRIMRDLNQERRRVVGPGDIARATENLILEDPTAVRFWWNESQQLVSADMLRIAFILLERQPTKRAGIGSEELIRECVQKGIKAPGNIVPEMILLELLTKSSKDGRLTIRSRFLEDFLVDLKSRTDAEQAATEDIRQTPLVGIAIDWENAKTRLVEVLNADPTRFNRLRKRCDGAALGLKLIEKAQTFGNSTQYTRVAVAGFEGNPFFREDRTALDNLNITTVNANMSGFAKADRSDHKLVERIRDILENNPTMKTFVLVTGDGDFSASVETLIDRVSKVYLLCTRTGYSHYFDVVQKNRARFEVEYLEDFALSE